NVLGQRERGRYSQIYCGKPTPEPVGGKRLRNVRAHCRNALLGTLRLAVKQVQRKLGPDPAQWKVFATCHDPNTCDEIVPNTSSGVSPTTRASLGSTACPSTTPARSMPRRVSSVRSGESDP